MITATELQMKSIIFKDVFDAIECLRAQGWLEGDARYSFNKEIWHGYRTLTIYIKDNNVIPFFTDKKNGYHKVEIKEIKKNRFEILINSENLKSSDLFIHHEEIN